MHARSNRFGVVTPIFSAQWVSFEIYGVTNEQAIETRKKQYLSEQTTAGPGKETVVLPGESGGVTCEQA